MNPVGLLPLFAWLSPAFPVGAFAYSHGLEQAVADGEVRDADSLVEWLRDLFTHGSVRTDLILAACAARAFVTEEMPPRKEDASPGFPDVAELAIALQPSRERRLESCQQGRSFLEAVCAAWPNAALDKLLAPSPEIAYPIAFGAAVAAHGLPVGDALAAYALQFAGNLVSAVVRLGVVGQTDGQRIVASLASVAARAAEQAIRASLADLGSASFRSDLASIRHETKYSRIFRS
jgi:urease accessory protein